MERRERKRGSETRAAIAEMKKRIRLLEQERDAALTAARQAKGASLDPVMLAAERTRSEAALREGEERFRCTFENAAVGIAHIGADGRWLRVNQHLCDLLGYSREEFMATTFQDLTHPDDLQVDLVQRKKLWQGEAEHGAWEKRYRHKDGHYLWVQLTGTLQRNGAGGPYFISVVEDISRRKISEQALRESEERFRSTFENAAEGIAHVGLDHRFLRVNPRLCTITGYSRDELMAKTFLEITDPEDIAGDLVFLNRLQLGEIDFFTREKRYLRKDDSTIWVQVTVSLQRDEKGAPLYYISMIEDISSRKEAERALRESEERLELATSSVAGGFWHLEMDPEHPSEVPDRLYLSPQLKATIGYADHEFPNSLAAWRGRMHPDDLARAEEAARRYMEGQFPVYEFEYRIRHRDGSWRWIYCRGRLLRDSRGRPLRWAGIDFDITAHKLLEEALRLAKEKAEAANRAKTEFLDNMSHEIRTPMTVAVGAVEMLQHLDPTPQQRPLLELADQSAHRLLNLIDDLLDMARIEAHRMEIQEETFDVRACVQQTVDLFAVPARSKGLRLEVEVAPGIPDEIAGDPVRLGQVLVNLISNAVKFTREGEVKVTVIPGDHSLQFAVSDTGIGIPADKQDRLFQSFSQVDSSLTRRYGGTGLGLAISRGLVELMGGEIRVESTEGKGSVFTFTLPLPSAVEFPSLPREKAFSAPATGRGRVLVAEDDPAIRQMITAFLAKRGLSTVTAASGREAVTRWENENVDVILMDVQMPEMSGLEAAGRIRELEGGEKHTCIIALTAHARPEVQAECESAGMDGFLTKPVKRGELYSAIDSCRDVD